ncbi:YciI family protein [Leifsonia sp. Leaf264]|uniref:YciI family protein n=1 Tax=Leifsonia sp. Leaf264 TaxID=1736314 RepID=UPI000700108A|nr:YciI family protein [Leifsonia sp. Leaf264]KQO96973.1 hypothetical protein ASF30_18125 [Leifsonia sp. Leaf264]
MPHNPDIPDAFDVYTLVILRRPADAAEMTDADLDALQRRHLSYRAELARRGVLVVNGPFDGQSDDSFRGMSIFACDTAEAERLTRADPSVVARRLDYEVMEWWVRADSLAFPLSADGGAPIGDRRSMPDD